jgi:ABC-2 type transport system ATP-binding protein
MPIIEESLMAVIEVRELTKRFGAVLAVDRLSFEVARGVVTGFLGPNGAGKTTTLRMLLGLVQPTAGAATIDGKRYRELPDRAHHVGAVLEASNAHPGRTARDHLKLRALAGHIDSRRVDEVLDLVGLTGAADRRLGGFSLGMRQRLGLAAALLGEPEVLILDEPTNGLDPEGIRWIRSLLRDIAAQGRTVLVSSHLLAEVAQTVDNVVVLDHGRLVTQSSLADLMAGARQVIRIRTPRAEELHAALAADGARSRVVAADRLEVTGCKPERVAMLAAQRWIPIVESTTETATLEELFFQLTTDKSVQEAAR